MEEKINEQTEQVSHTAAAEREVGEKGEVSLGKFKDVSALLDAYNSLQSEFTKRCQKIKELEGKLDSVDKAAAPTEAGGATDKPEQDTNLKDEEQVLKEYLLGVLGKKPSAIIIDGMGAGVKTPSYKPKTIEEAGKIACEIFTK